MKNVRPNLFDLCPLQICEFELTEEGRVRVLVPKFRNRFLVKWFVPYLESPTTLVTLDKLGSFVWRQCDGRTTVGEIVERIRTEFAEDAEAVDERITKFLYTMQRSDLIRMQSGGPRDMHD